MSECSCCKQPVNQPGENWGTAEHPLCHRCSDIFAEMNHLRRVEEAAQDYQELKGRWITPVCPKCGYDLRYDAGGRPTCRNCGQHYRVEDDGSLEPI